jgi:hypothetical protein
MVLRRFGPDQARGTPLNPRGAWPPIGIRRHALLRLLVAIVLVALAAVGLRLSQDEDNFGVVRGVLDEAVAFSGGTVTASQVRVGTTLVRSDKVSARTPGLFVVVRLQIAATGTKSVPTFDGRVLSGNRRYQAFEFLAGGHTEPGLAASLDAVFEVDPATLDDLTLELYPVELVSGFTERARIHLGITPGNAEQWRAAGRDQIIELAERTIHGI